MKKNLIAIAILVVVSIAQFTLPAFADDGCIFSLDLSPYDVGEKPIGLDSITYCVSDGVESSDDNPNAGTANFIIKEATSTEDGSKIKYVEYGPATDTAYSNSFGYRFSSAYDESFAVELGFKIVSGTGGRSFRRIGTSKEILSFTNKGAANNPKADAYGFYRLLIVCERISDTQYTITSYDRMNDNSLLRTITQDITSWEGINLFTYGKIGVSTAVAQMDIYPYVFPTVEGVDTENLELADDELTLKFDKDMDETLFSDSSFVLTDVTADRNVAISFKSYDSSSKYAVIKLREYLDDGHEYKLTFVGLADKFGLEVKEDEAVTFTTDFGYANISDVTFSNSDGTEIHSLENVLNPKANVCITSVPEGNSVSILLALFDEEGRLVDSDCKTASAATTLTPTLAGSVNIESGFSLKCYAWETTSSGITALWELAKILE